MTSTNSSKPNFGRRIRWLGIGAAIAAALYTGGWFYVAQEGEKRIDAAISAFNQNEGRVACDSRSIKGYPFRFGLFCDSITFEQTQEGVSFSAGALRSAAQIYNPKHAIVELDGPAQLDAPGLEPLTLNWELLHGSVRVARPLPERVSLEAKALQIAIRGQSGADKQVLTADYAAGHMRQEEKDMAFAGEWGGLIIDPTITPNRTVPEFATSYDFVLTNGVALLASKPKSARRSAGNIRLFTIIFKEGGTLKLSGPVSVDNAGLIDGEIEVAFLDAAKLGEALGKALPEAAKVIKPALSMAGAAAGEGKEAKLTLTIRKGKISAGFFPIGQIPPLQ